MTEFDIIYIEINLTSSIEELRDTWYTSKGLHGVHLLVAILLLLLKLVEEALIFLNPFNQLHVLIKLSSQAIFHVETHQFLLVFDR